MESNPYYNYSNQPSYYATNAFSFGHSNKREAKTANRLQGNPPGAIAMRSNSRWQNPISKQDINMFYSQYKDFIDAAKLYRENVLGIKPEPEQPPAKR